MSEIDFEKAKVGDRVFSPLFRSKNPDDKTNGVIVSTHKNEPWNIVVEFDLDGIQRSFTNAGQYFNIEAGQVLFWENPIKEIPVRPKRKVVKKGYFVSQPCEQNDLHPGRIGLIPTELYDSPQRLEGSLGYDGRQLVSVDFEVEE